MTDDKDAERRSAIASKLVVSDFLNRLMGFFGYAGLPREMKAALDGATVSSSSTGSRQGGLDTLARPLAACVDVHAPATLAPALQQLTPFRELAASALSGKSGRELRDRIANLVRKRRPDRSDLAVAIADRQLALICGWLTDPASPDAEAMAATIHAETRKFFG